MIDALYIAASGLNAEQKQIDIISNNVANMQTPGFKRTRVVFSDVTSATPAQIEQGQVVGYGGAGTRVLSSESVFSEGQLRGTGNPLDLAIEGPGFFEVQASDGSRLYTRAGQLQVNNQGYLVTTNGLRLSGDIQIPPDAKKMKIDGQGNVTAILGNDTYRSRLGTIELAVFPAPDSLRSVGNNAFAPTSAAGDPSIGHPGDTGFGQIQQGYLELANVNMVSEMTSLVIAQRAYQLNARLIQAADQILDTINNLKR